MANDLKNKTLSSSIFLFIGKTVERSIGLVSTLLLARLLLPEDFGLVAIVSLFMYFFNILTNSGSVEYICQKDNVNDADINTAWTLDLMMKFVVFLLFILLAPYLAAYYDNPELTYPFYTISLVFIFTGLANPSLMKLKRNLEYRKIFQMMVLIKLLTFPVVVGVAFVTKSYWALIIGDVAAAFIFLLMSYFIFPYRPKFSLDNIGQQWKFSKWILGKGFVGYGRAQIDIILASKLFGIADLGRLHMIKGFTVIPATSIVSPLLEPLIAALSTFRKDIDVFSEKVHFSLVSVIFLISPIMLFTFYYPEYIVEVFLGDKWLHSVLLLHFMSILLFPMAIGNVLSNAMMSLGKSKSLFLYDVLTLGMVAGFMISLSTVTLEKFVLMRVLLELLVVAILFGFLSRHIKIFCKRLLSTMLAVYTCGFISKFLADTVHLKIDSDNVYVNFLVLVSVFFSIYLILSISYVYALRNRVKEYRFLFGIFVFLSNRLIGRKFNE